MHGRADAELRRQVENLVAKGYPALAGLEQRAFVELVRPLEERVREVAEGERFVVVVRGLPPVEAVERVELAAKRGFTTMDADDLARFAPLPELEVPAASAYLLAGVDTGAKTLDVTPDDALRAIVAARRSPLTVEEGLALVTQFPELLRTANCFSMLGSRAGDRRVTAIWVSRGRPRLGWCWAGNPHSWLGSASCRTRLGARVGELAASR